jgi:hypothetical protein
MGATLTSMSPILKTQYLGPLREQLNNKIILLNRIEKDMESVVGKNFTIPLHTGRNEGIGAKAEGATLPTAGSQSYKETIVPMRYLYGRIKLTGQTIAAASKDEGAFLRAVDSEMKGLTKDLKTDLNRQLFSDGSGALTLCGTTSNATTVVVSSTAKLRAGMVIDVIKTADGTTGTGAVGVTILTIASSTTFTVASAITTDTDYSVYKNGARNIEVMGLKGICDDADPASGALQGLAVATYTYWKAGDLNNSATNRALTEVLMQSAEDYADQIGDGTCSALFTTYGVRRAYQQLLQAQRIYQNTMKFDAGLSA